MGTLNFKKHRSKPKIDLVDSHRTKNGQNTPSWSGLVCSQLYISFHNPKKIGINLLKICIGEILTERRVCFENYNRIFWVCSNFLRFPWFDPGYNQVLVLPPQHLLYGEKKETFCLTHKTDTRCRIISCINFQPW